MLGWRFGCDKLLDSSPNLMTTEAFALFPLLHKEGNKKGADRSKERPARGFALVLSSPKSVVVSV